MVEDPESFAYVREEGVGLLFGLFEPEGATSALNGFASDARTEATLSLVPFYDPKSERVRA